MRDHTDIGGHPPVGGHVAGCNHQVALPEPVGQALELSKASLGPFVLVASPAQRFQPRVVKLDTVPGGARDGAEVSGVHEPMPGRAEYRLAIGPGDPPAGLGAEDSLGGGGGRARLAAARWVAGA